MLAIHFPPEDEDETGLPTDQYNNITLNQHLLGNMIVICNACKEPCLSGYLPNLSIVISKKGTIGSYMV